MANRPILLSSALALGLALGLACQARKAGPIPPVPTAPGAGSAPTRAQTLDAPLAGDPLAVTIHRLSNGLTVMISPEPSEPRVSAWIAFRNGSRHDPADSTGLAHYLEHMLFKGSTNLGTTDIKKEEKHLARIAALYDRLEGARASERVAILAEIDRENAASAKYSIPNELDQLYAEMGISGVNAFTGEDMTVYITDVPSNRFEAWAKVEGDRFQHPRFRLFYPELETVYEEKNRSLDNPRSQVYHAMMRALFPVHPYGTQPTIGTVEHLKTPAYGDMVDYFERWYVPGNAAIVLSGDITPEVALPVLERYFSGWKSKPVDQPAAAEIVPLEGRREVVVTAPGEESVTMAWQTVPAGHPDELALEVLDLLVDNSSTGMVNLDLLLTQKLPKAGASPEFMNDAGYWQLRGTAKAGQTHAQVEALLMGIVAKLKRGEFTQADIDANLVNAEIRAKREQETRRARVGKMAFAFLQRRDWRKVATKLERMKKVSKNDVVRVANRYLGDGRAVILRKRGKTNLPKIDKPKITAISVKTGRRSAFAKEIAAMPAGPVEPKFLQVGRDYQLVDTNNGRLIATPNAINDLFEVTWVWDAGYRSWPLACLALSVVENAGAAGLDAKALKRKLYSLGTSVSTRCARDRLSLTIRGIDRHMDESVRLVNALVAAPSFDGKLVAELAKNQVSRRKDQVRDPRFLARATAGFAALGKASRSMTRAPDRVLEAATPAKLRNTLTLLASSKHSVRYFGPRKADAAAAAAVLGKATKPVPTASPVRYRRVAGARVYVMPQKVAQSNISIFFPGPALSFEDELWADLYSEYVGGGMGALIFQEIREARGLAYSATGYYQTGTRKGDQATGVGRLGTQVDKTREAVAKMLELLPVPPIRDQRFELAKASWLRRNRTSRIAPRSVARQVHGYLDKGWKSDPGPRFWALMNKATADDLRRFAAKIASRKPIIGMVTDLARVSMKELGKFGKVVKLKPAQVVSFDD